MGIVHLLVGVLRGDARLAALLLLLPYCGKVLRLDMDKDKLDKSVDFSLFFGLHGLLAVLRLWWEIEVMGVEEIK